MLSQRDRRILNVDFIVALWYDKSIICEGGITMNPQSSVIEYKCPCCSAGLQFRGNTQRLKCDYCESEFEIDAVVAYNDSLNRQNSTDFNWNASNTQSFSDQEQSEMNAFLCPSCGGEIIADSTSAATFCPYCDNPTIMPSRLDGLMKPDAIIPFTKTKEDAKAAFLNLCKGKPLLPKEFTNRQRLEKISGIYVPFWLYDCNGQLDGTYKATRVSTWSDSRYNYTKTDHYLVRRNASAVFQGIPMDGTSKMDDTFMESIEPYDYGQLITFNKAYLSGYLADKYDVPAEAGNERVKQRVSQSFDDMLRDTFLGYASVVPTSKQLQVQHGNANYVMLPVWILNTRYEGKLYTFAMNGQTGKMTGTLPICKKRAIGWFALIAGAVSVLAGIVQLIIL